MGTISGQINVVALPDYLTRVLFSTEVMKNNSQIGGRVVCEVIRCMSLL